MAADVGQVAVKKVPDVFHTPEDSLRILRWVSTRGAGVMGQGGGDSAEAGPPEYCKVGGRVGARGHGGWGGVSSAACDLARRI